jgi:hypothetical protein
LEDATSDETSLSLWGLFASITVYIVYAIYKDLQHEWPTIEEARANRRGQVSQNVTVNNNDLSPHSAELPVSTPSDEMSEQNIKFVDTHPGFMQETPGDIDHIRDAALATDATLEEFFSRPLRIRSFDWGVGANLFQRFNPWQDYFENPRVINRIANYKLMRAKLHLKFTINGNAFHYGRLICSYNPLPDDDSMTVDRAFLDADIVAASQRPHVYLDPTNSQGGEMKLPFFTPKNVLDIVAMDWRNMGELVIHSMQGLKHANGATDSVTVNVFAWAEDVKFAIPTNFEPGAISPQADEYGKKPMSRIAGVVANAASYFTDIPVIGPFARATEIGASAMGAIATLFGYSAPVNLESSQFRPVTTYNIATTNQPNESAKLTLDCKNELTLDPRTVGLEGKDEMTIKYISQRESWFSNFSWTIGTTRETLLWNHVVDPCLHYVQGNELHMPAVCFAAVPFKFWRGTLKYRFQFVCSKYHKGRVKIVYDPTGTPSSGTAEYNTAYTTIVDISDNTDFEIAVGWGQRDPYREHFSVGSVIMNQMFGTTPLALTTPASVIGNGTLSVYVVNELTVPNSTTNNDIEVNVFVSAGDDFEVAVPDSFTMQRLRYRSAGQTIAPQSMEILPHAGETEEMGEESKPADVLTVNQIAKTVRTNDETNMVYFGESVHSFRSLLKRYCRHGFIAGFDLATTAPTRLTAWRSAMPYQPGYCNSVIPSNNVVYTLGIDKYAYGVTTLLNYLTPAFGGWRGSIRWMVDTSLFADNGEEIATITATRVYSSIGNNNTWSQKTLLTDTAAGQAQLVNNTNDFSRAFDGQLYQSTAVNPLVMFEVPYYRNARFTPAKRHDRPSISDSQQPGWMLQMDCTSSFRVDLSHAPTYCAAGEDFNLFFFLGAPIMYYETEAPST